MKKFVKSIGFALIAMCVASSASANLPEEQLLLNAQFASQLQSEIREAQHQQMLDLHAAIKQEVNSHIQETINNSAAVAKTAIAKPNLVAEQHKNDPVRSAAL